MLEEILKIRFPDSRSTQPDPSAAAFLVETGVSLDAVRQLALNPSSESIEIGNLKLFSFSHIQYLNCNDDIYRPWCRDGYVTIGCGANCDPVAIDVKTDLMAFIHHDEMDYDDPLLVPSKHVIHTPLSFNEFWRNADADAEFPLDAYAAERIWGRPERKFVG